MNRIFGSANQKHACAQMDARHADAVALAAHLEVPHIPVIVVAPLLAEYPYDLWKSNAAERT